MAVDIEKMLRNFEGRVVCIELPPSVAGKLDAALSESVISREQLIQATDKNREYWYKKAVDANKLVYGVFQFIIDKHAPEEYKQLNNPPIPDYNTFLQKMSFRIIESDMLEFNRTMKTVAMKQFVSKFFDRSSNDGTQDKN